MLIFDAHNDTVTRAMNENKNLLSNNLHVSIDRLNGNKDNNFILCNAIFIHPYKTNNYKKSAENAIDYFDKFVKKSIEHQGFFYCSDNVYTCLTLEGGHVLEGDPENIDYFFNRGVRAISLTWNYSNELAGGSFDEKNGISPLGKAILKRMEELNIILDLSHISHKSFYEALENFNGKVIASHSNAYELCNHRRNLTDDQIKFISKRNGVIGINFYPDILNISGKASMVDIIKNIEYISAIGGINSVGIGADFDGIDILPEGINGIEDLEKIIIELEKLNYKEREIELIMGNNFFRVFKF
jgi:membrane dipeptidase